jgi:hypothetical protein
MPHQATKLLCKIKPSADRTELAACGRCRQLFDCHGSYGGSAADRAGVGAVLGVAAMNVPVMSRPVEKWTTDAG